MKVLEFAQIVQRLTQTKSEIVFVTPTDERTKDDPMMRRPDITRARTILGWEPQVTVDEGISRTIEYFRARFAAAE